MPSSTETNLEHQHRRQAAKPGEPFNILRADIERNLHLYESLLPTQLRSTSCFAVRCYELVWAKPELLEANRDSLLLAFAEAAVQGLNLSPLAKQVYIETRGNIARLGTQYQGLITLMHRSNDIDGTVQAGVVRRGDFFEQLGGLTPGIKHTYAPLDEPAGYDKDDAILATYAIVRLRGASFPTYEVARRADLLKAQAKSKGKGGSPPSPAWADWFDRMAMKVPVRRLANLLPHADEVRTAISLEDQRDQDRYVIHPRVAEVFGNLPMAGSTGARGADTLDALMAASGPAGRSEEGAQP